MFSSCSESSNLARFSHPLESNTLVGTSLIMPNVVVEETENPIALDWTHDLSKTTPVFLEDSIVPDSATTIHESPFWVSVASQSTSTVCQKVPLEKSLETYSSRAEPGLPQQHSDSSLSHKASSTIACQSQIPANTPNPVDVLLTQHSRVSTPDYNHEPSVYFSKNFRQRFLISREKKYTEEPVIIKQNTDFKWYIASVHSTKTETCEKGTKCGRDQSFALHNLADYIELKIFSNCGSGVQREVQGCYNINNAVTAQF